MAVASVRTCPVCNEAMVAVEPDQLTNPCCDPDDTTQPVLSLDEIAALISDLGQCQDCAQPIHEPGLMKKCRPQHKAATP
jgi:hypothetical protein